MKINGTAPVKVVRLDGEWLVVAQGEKEIRVAREEAKAIQVLPADGS